jgi:hypothetical protein
MNCSRFQILIPFSKSVALFRIARFLFAITSNSHLSISIAFHCASVFACTSMDYYTSTCISVNSHTSTSTTLSSPTSFCVVYSSTKCYSTTLSSSNSSMNTRFVDVVHGPVYSFTCQLLLLLLKNSTIDVLILYIS